MTIDEVKALLAGMDRETLREVLRTIREDYQVTIHQLEDEWGTNAEAILEAIHSSPDLTQRGVRGVLAEATFRRVVVPTLGGWVDEPFQGDLPYDLMLTMPKQRVRVQVKQQRRSRGICLFHRASTEARPVYVVETQRTRTGTDKTTGNATRPYRKDEFDLIAVCLQASSGRWTDFIYCPSHRLDVRADNPALLAVMQPVYLDGSHGWTRDFNEAVRDLGPGPR